MFSYRSQGESLQGGSRRPSSCVRHSGYTLFEMLIVMGIVAILAAIALPSYRYVINANRIAAEVNGLLGDLQFARAEAIKEGLAVTTCASTNATSCNGTAWNTGWIVFLDVGGDANPADAGDAVLRVQKQFNGNDTFVANPAVTYVSFNRQGFASGNAAFNTSATGTTITLHAMPSSAGSTRCLAISTIGMMQVLQSIAGTTCI